MKLSYLVCVAVSLLLFAILHRNVLHRVTLRMRKRISRNFSTGKGQCMGSLFTFLEWRRAKENVPKNSLQVNYCKKCWNSFRLILSVVLCCALKLANKNNPPTKVFIIFNNIIFFYNYVFQICKIINGSFNQTRRPLGVNSGYFCVW